MIRNADNDMITDLVYAAALDETLWPEVMARLADLVGGGAGAFVRKNITNGQGRAVYSRIDSAAFVDYFGHFAQRNPLAAAIGPRGAGTVLIDWQSVPKAELMRSDYYNDFLRPRDIHGVLGLVLWRDGDDVAVMSLTSTPRHGDFLTEDAARLLPFLPHLRRAVDFSRRLPTGFPLAAELSPVIDTWPDALFLVEANGRLRYANRAAEAILNRQDGLSLVHGRLSAPELAAARRLQIAIHGASVPEAGAAGSSLALPRGPEQRPYAVLVMPARDGQGLLGAQSGRVILMVIDLDAERHPPAATLMETFGLSRAQVSVATLLADGHDLREISETLKLSPHTVRRHLADIMARTETNRQAQLVRLMARLPAGRMRAPGPPRVAAPAAAAPAGPPAAIAPPP
jgi:DNA-binding CsgD family transcriptional regulator